MRRALNQNADGKRPYTKGWQAPWKGDWGPLGDSHSKLGHLRRTIEKRLIKTYKLDSENEDHADHLDLVRDASGLLAVAKMISEQIGLDPKASPRKAIALHRAANGLLRPLRATRNGEPKDLARRLAAAQREGAR